MKDDGAKTRPMWKRTDADNDKAPLPTEVKAALLVGT